MRGRNLSSGRTNVMFRDSEDAISRQTLLCKYGGNALQLDQNNESIVSKLQSLISALRHEM